MGPLPAAPGPPLSFDLGRHSVPNRLIDLVPPKLFQPPFLPPPIPNSAKRLPCTHTCHSSPPITPIQPLKPLTTISPEDIHYNLPYTPCVPGIARIRRIYRNSLEDQRKSIANHAYKLFRKKKIPLPLPRKAEEIAADLLRELDCLLVAIPYYDVSFGQLGYHLDPLTFERFNCLLMGYVERSKTQLRTRLSRPIWGSDDYPLHVWSFHDFEMLAVLFRDEVESFLAFLYHHGALISVSSISKISKSVSFSVKEESSVRGDTLNDNVTLSGSTQTKSSTSTKQFGKDDISILNICDNDIPRLSLNEWRDDTIQHYPKNLETGNLNSNCTFPMSILKGLQELGTLSELSYLDVQATPNKTCLKDYAESETKVIIDSNTKIVSFSKSLFARQSLKYLKQKIQSRSMKSYLHCLLSEDLEPRVKSSISRILETKPAFEFPIASHNPLKSLLRGLYLENRTTNIVKPFTPSPTSMTLHEDTRVFGFLSVLPQNQSFLKSTCELRTELTFAILVTGRAIETMLYPINIHGIFLPGQITVYRDPCLIGYLWDFIYALTFNTTTSTSFLMTAVNLVLAEFIINDTTYPETGITLEIQPVVQFHPVAHILLKSHLKGFYSKDRIINAFSSVQHISRDSSFQNPTFHDSVLTHLASREYDRYLLLSGTNINRKFIDTSSLRGSFLKDYRTLPRSAFKWDKFLHLRILDLPSFLTVRGINESLNRIIVNCNSYLATRLVNFIHRQLTLVPSLEPNHVEISFLTIASGFDWPNKAKDILVKICNIGQNFNSNKHAPFDLSHPILSLDVCSRVYSHREQNYRVQILEEFKFILVFEATILLNDNFTHGQSKITFIGKPIVSILKSESVYPKANLATNLNTSLKKISALTYTSGKVKSEGMRILINSSSSARNNTTLTAFDLNPPTFSSGSVSCPKSLLSPPNMLQLNNLWPVHVLTNVSVQKDLTLKQMEMNETEDCLTNFRVSMPCSDGRKESIKMNWNKMVKLAFEYLIAIYAIICSILSLLLSRFPSISALKRLVSLKKTSNSTSVPAAVVKRRDNNSINLNLENLSKRKFLSEKGTNLISNKDGINRVLTTFKSKYPLNNGSYNHAQCGVNLSDFGNLNCLTRKTTLQRFRIKETMDELTNAWNTSSDVPNIRINVCDTLAKNWISILNGLLFVFYVWSIIHAPVFSFGWVMYLRSMLVSKEIRSGHKKGLSVINKIFAGNSLHTLFKQEMNRPLKQGIDRFIKRYDNYRPEKKGLSSFSGISPLSRLLNFARHQSFIAERKYDHNVTGKHVYVVPKQPRLETRNVKRHSLRKDAGLLRKNRMNILNKFTLNTLQFIDGLAFLLVFTSMFSIFASPMWESESSKSSRAIVGHREPNLNGIIILYDETFQQQSFGESWDVSSWFNRPVRKKKCSASYGSDFGGELISIQNDTSLCLLHSSTYQNRAIDRQTRGSIASRLIPKLKKIYFSATSCFNLESGSNKNVSRDENDVSINLNKLTSSKPNKKEPFHEMGIVAQIQLALEKSALALNAHYRRIEDLPEESVLNEEPCFKLNQRSQNTTRITKKSKRRLSRGRALIKTRSSKKEDEINKLSFNSANENLPVYEGKVKRPKKEYLSLSGWSWTNTKGSYTKLIKRLNSAQSRNDLMVNALENKTLTLDNKLVASIGARARHLHSSKFRQVLRRECFIKNRKTLPLSIELPLYLLSKQGLVSHWNKMSKSGIFNSTRLISTNSSENNFTVNDSNRIIVLPFEKVFVNFFAILCQRLCQISGSYLHNPKQSYTTSFQDFHLNSTLEHFIWYSKPPHLNFESAIKITGSYLNNVHAKGMKFILVYKKLIEERNTNTPSTKVPTKRKMPILKTSILTNKFKTRLKSSTALIWTTTTSSHTRIQEVFRSLGFDSLLFKSQSNHSSMSLKHISLFF